MCSKCQLPVHHNVRWWGCFYANGEVNRQNTRYWSHSPHWFTASEQHGVACSMMWCGIWKDRITGPFPFLVAVTGDAYSRILNKKHSPVSLNTDGDFQQDGALAHYSICVREWLHRQFPGHWIGRRGPVEWLPRRLDLTPLDLYLWGHWKELVYAEKILWFAHLWERIMDSCNTIHTSWHHSPRGCWLDTSSAFVHKS
jgi:hypothetical protein